MTNIDANSEITSGVSLPEGSENSSGKYLSKDEMNDIYKDAYDRQSNRYRKLAAEQPDYLLEKLGLKDKYILASQVSSQKSPEDIEKLVEAKMNHVAVTNYANQVAMDFQHKVSMVKGKYSDYESIVSDNFNALSAYPNVVLAVNGLDNPGDVIYQLLKTPERLVSLDELAKRDQAFNTNLLKSSLITFSNNIKENEKIKGTKTANPPLDQMPPSNNGFALGKGEKSDQDLLRERKALYRKKS